MDSQGCFATTPPTNPGVEPLQPKPRGYQDQGREGVSLTGDRVVASPGRLSSFSPLQGTNPPETVSAPRNLQKL